MPFRNLRYSFFNLVSYSPDSLDEITLCVVHLPIFLAQMPDVYHHRIVAVLKVLFLPDLLKQLLRADDPAPVLHRAATRMSNSIGVRTSSFSLQMHSCVSRFITSPAKSIIFSDAALRRSLYFV